jgi:hypothetical protein
VPGGAPEMTGVLLLELGGSLLLQPVIKISPQRKMLAQRRKGAKIFLWPFCAFARELFYIWLSSSTADLSFCS